METYKTVRIPANVPGIGYTLKHRDVVEKLINYHCRRVLNKVDGNGVPFTQQDLVIMRNRGICHDMDKVCTSLSYPQLLSDYFHRIFNGHHMECIYDPQLKLKYDWMEMIFDWESARYTKPDKGKCAYEMATTIYAPYYAYLKPYLELFGFTTVDHSVIKEIKDSVKIKLTEEDLLEAIMNYIHATRIHQLEYTSRDDDVSFGRTNGKSIKGRDQRSIYSGYNFMRPSNYVAGNKFASNLEMFNGVLQASLFDMDMLCAMPVSSVASLEQANKQVHNYLQQNKMQR